MAKPIYTNIADMMRKYTFHVRAPAHVAPVSEYDMHFNMTPAFKPTGTCVLCDHTATIQQFIEWHFNKISFEFADLQDIDTVFAILDKYLNEMDKYGTANLSAQDKVFLQRAEAFFQEMCRVHQHYHGRQDYIRGGSSNFFLNLLSKAAGVGRNS